MAKKENKTQRITPYSKGAFEDPFKRRSGKVETDESASLVHVLRPGIICDTERRGHTTPEGKSITDIVVDASDGFIPLWVRKTTLRWRFRERSFTHFAHPAAAKAATRALFAEALLEWGVAAPVKFKEDKDLWDFEIVIRSSDECEGGGCVLASAFFPDAGRHKLVIYPMMFSQTKAEQVETMVHEIGHVFGLRHFFANISETEFSSEIFGTHSKFSIMNYGELSKLTTADRRDLTNLYKRAWKGTLTEINGTPIRFVRPYSALRSATENAFAVTDILE